MVYLVYAASALLGTAFVWLALKAFGVSNIKYVEAKAVESDAVETSEDIQGKKIITYSKSQTIVILVLFALVSFLVALATGKNTIAVEMSPRLIIGYIKLFSVFVIIAASAFIDFKKRIIPNKLVLVGLAFRAILYLCEFVWCRDIIVEIVKSDLTGFFIGFGILFVAGLVSRGAVGFGDAKLFAVIGLTASSLATFGTLLFSLIASSVCGIFLLIKYRDRKRTFPFAPFILIGYSIVIFMGNF